MDRAARGEIEFGFRNLDENARLIYYVGQQILWGMLAGDGGRAGRRLRRPRPAARHARPPAIAAGVCGLLLIGNWFSGHPKRPRGRR